MIRANHVLVVVAFMCPASVLAADPAHEPDPVVRAAQSVGANLERQPDNKGLQNAAERLQENKLRFDSKHETKNKGQSSQSNGATAEQPARPVAVDQPVRPESVQRPERVEKPERVARPERPERVERPERPERAERPQHGNRR